MATPSAFPALETKDVEPTSNGSARGAKQPSPSTGKKRAFRETGWFNKGELEEQLAREAAEKGAEDPLAGAPLPVVVEDSAITGEDRARLSLRTGRTETMKPIAPLTLPGEQMSEREMVAELGGAEKRRRVALYAAAAFALLVVLAFVFLRAPHGA